MDDQAALERVARVESLLGEVEALADPAGREKAAEVVQALVELYGEGLERITDGLGDGSQQALAELAAGDELVSHLLLLHDLHPVPLEQRVRDGLEGVRPYLESHGGGVELVGVEDGVAHLRLQGSCSGCPSSTMTLKLAIEDALYKVAPDLDGIEAEGVSEAAAPLLQIEIADGLGGGRRPEPVPNGASWATVGGLPELSGGGNVLKQVSGEELLFARVEEDLYAYRPGCPGCGESLEGASMRGADLTCPGCSLAYDLRRAGRCLDEPQLHLEPVPLLMTDSGLAKVALGSVVA